MTSPLPSPVQDAVTTGRALPGVTVHVSDQRGIPSEDTVTVDYLTGDIEVGTVWAPDAGAWQLSRAAWRSLAEQDTLHPLDTWEQVQAFLAEHTR